MARLNHFENVTSIKKMQNALVTLLKVETLDFVEDESYYRAYFYISSLSLEEIILLKEKITEIENQHIINAS